MSDAPRVVGDVIGGLPVELQDGRYVGPDAAKTADLLVRRAWSPGVFR